MSKGTVRMYEQDGMWAVEQHEEGVIGKNTSWCKTQAEAEKLLAFKVKIGYEIVDEPISAEPAIVTSNETGLVYDQPQPLTGIIAEALVDAPAHTLVSVLEVAAKQEHIHPRDVSFIMDGLSVRQCRAFVTHSGFSLDSALDWALKLGLVLPNGEFTPKGHAFRKSIG